MAIIKCKMCGGSLDISEDMSVAECEYCGTVQTVPKVDDEKKLKLFERANRLRAACDFDKAYGVYESIVADFDTEAEAYWGLILCKYGIEYVDDPATGKKVPTCHRSGFDCVLEDENFELVMENCDDYSRRIYREEAKAIEELRKSILAVSSKEEPYDVFISYKELDATGERTIDSVIAQDIYERLTEKGYRVFFSRISLEDKLGVEYEPYIFAALNSAKLMLVVGTAYENFNAVWVKNEWSRYLAIMSKDHSKMLIPCFKDIDAYDMPKEFNKLAAQDMGKVGAMQDLLRGVEKIVGKKTAEAAPAQPVYQSESSTKGAAALKRGYMALEDGEWENADKYFEQALELDAECAEAYLGKFLAERKSQSLESFVERSLSGIDGEWKSVPACAKRHERASAAVAKYALQSFLSENEIKSLYPKDVPTYYESLSGTSQKANALLQSVNADKNITKAQRFAKSEFEVKLNDAIKKLNDGAKERVSDARAEAEENKQRAIASYEAALDAADMQAESKYKSAVAAREKQYNSAVAEMETAATEEDFRALSKKFSQMLRLNDSAEKKAICEKKIAEIQLAAAKKAEEERIAAAKKAEEKKIALAQLRARSEKLSRLISAGHNHTVGLKVDGTVAFVGENKYGQLKVSDWRDIVSIVAGINHTVGLKADGTVAATKYAGEARDYCGQCEVSEWEGIVSIAAGINHTVGLKADGTVAATKYTGEAKYYSGEGEVFGWRNIAAIAASSYHTVGLKADGTVVAVGSKDFGRCEVSQWTGIVEIAAGHSHTVGLKADGTVVATKYTGNNYNGQCEVSGWTDVVAISAGKNHTVGLKADGTVVATKYIGDKKYYHGQCEVSEWEGIVSIAAGDWHTVGLKADGTVVATEYVEGVFGKYSDQCDVDDWKLFECIETLEDEKRIAAAKKAEEERIAAAKRAEEERTAAKTARIAELTAEKEALTAELPNLQGMFKAGKRKETEARLAEIDKELAALTGNK